MPKKNSDWGPLFWLAAWAAVDLGLAVMRGVVEGVKEARKPKPTPRPRKSKRQP